MANRLDITEKDVDFLNETIKDALGVNGIELIFNFENIDNWIEGIVPTSYNFELNGKYYNGKHEKKFDSEMVEFFKEPLENMPVYINGENSIFAEWRLKIGK